jgi:hypothetical protein
MSIPCHAPDNIWWKPEITKRVTGSDNYINCYHIILDAFPLVIHTALRELAHVSSSVTVYRIVANSYGFGLVASSSSKLLLKLWVSLDVWQQYLDGQPVARPLPTQDSTTHPSGPDVGTDFGSHPLRFKHQASTLTARPPAVAAASCLLVTCVPDVQAPVSLWQNSAIVYLAFGKSQLSFVCQNLLLLCNSFIECLNVRHFRIWNPFPRAWLPLLVLLYYFWLLVCHIFPVLFLFMLACYVMIACNL